MHMRSVSMSINTTNVWDLHISTNFTDCIYKIYIFQTCLNLPIGYFKQPRYLLVILLRFTENIEQKQPVMVSIIPAVAYSLPLFLTLDCLPVVQPSYLGASVQKLCSSQFLNQAECSCLLLVIILSIFGVYVTCLPVVGLFNPEERKWKKKYSIILYFSSQNFRNLQIFNGLLKGWSFN